MGYPAEGVRWRFRAGAPRVTGECRDLVKSRAHRVSDLGEGPGKQGNREVTSDRLGAPTQLGQVRASTALGPLPSGLPCGEGN